MTAPPLSRDEIVNIVSPAATLTECDLEMFHRIGVTSDLLNAARVSRVSNLDARRQYGIQGPASREMAGIVFPYYSHLTDLRVTARVRRDFPEIEAGIPKNKYVSPYGDPRHLYFPPGAAEKLKHQDTSIVLVEAEKSALAITSWATRVDINVLAVGMGGCWGWRGRIGRTESIDGSRTDVTGPLSDLSVCDGRKVYVLLDSNVERNPKVRQAEKALAITLAERRCDVQIRRIPRLRGVNGPDDLIAIQGDDAMRQSLLIPICANDGPGILEAAQEAISDNVYASERERFYAFCVAMQRLRGPEAVALPLERIASLLGCHYTTLGTYRREFVAGGLLQKVGSSVPHVRAASFLVDLQAGAPSKNFTNIANKDQVDAASKELAGVFSKNSAVVSSLTKGKAILKGRAYIEDSYSKGEEASIVRIEGDPFPRPTVQPDNAEDGNLPLPQAIAPRTDRRDEKTARGYQSQNSDKLLDAQLETQGLGREIVNTSRRYKGMARRTSVVAAGGTYSPFPTRVLLSDNDPTRSNPLPRIESTRTDANSMLFPKRAFAAEGEV